jgi:Dyp-type peroxidase family
MLNFADIQGNLLRGYRFPLVRYTFVTIHNAESGRRWLDAIRRHVTTAGDWGEVRPSATLNVAFTHAGLAALGLPPGSLDSFPSEFRKGALERAHMLGDKDESDPANWDEGLGHPARYAALHVLFVIYAVDKQALDEQYDMVLSFAADDGVGVIYRQDAALLSGGMEHFGFRDDISQPAVSGGSHTEYPGHGTPLPGDSWGTLATGEFILGQPAEGGFPLPSPSPQVLGKNGSYLVYRKLHQRVAPFRQYLKQTAASLSRDEEWLAAKMVGRWRDGTPTELSPDRNDPALADDPAKNNNFRYATDPTGQRCPIGAHIRRANPRDALAGGASAVVGHRMLRRGMPYGPPLPDDSPEDGVDRGLVFVAACGSIRTQFEFVQQEWMNSGGFAGLDPSQKDPCVGSNDGTGVMVIPMSDYPRRIFNLIRFVNVRLSVYLFIPSIKALEFLSDASTD